MNQEKYLHVSVGDKAMNTIIPNKQLDILNTALRLYYAHGFNSIGIDRIILESNVAKMTYYKYYTAKVNIYEACLNHEVNEIQTGVMDTIDRLSNADPVQRIYSLFSWFYNRANVAGYNGMLYQKARAELSNDSCFEIINKYYAWLDQLINDLFTNAKLSQPDIKTKIATTFIDGMLQAPKRVSYTDLNVFLNSLICTSGHQIMV